MSIYTKTGDKGETSLFGGKRVLKCEELVDVYGSIDELNSWVGLIISRFNTPDVQQFLELIQNDLFIIGSTLAGWKGDKADLKKRVSEMEARIDTMEKGLPTLNNFIFPGGTELAATLHIVRSVCRRTERQAVALSKHENVDPNIIIYLNRLSDLFFTLARFINTTAGVTEKKWSKVHHTG
jgi:cob(I)alamin adenosyltransferase